MPLECEWGNMPLGHLIKMQTWIQQSGVWGGGEGGELGFGLSSNFPGAAAAASGGLDPAGSSRRSTCSPALHNQRHGAQPIRV